MFSLLWPLLHILFGTPEQLTQNGPVFQEQVVDSTISIGYGIALGDVDGDGKPDILLADKTQVVWYRNGDWKKFVMADSLTGRDNVCIAAADIDGDGKVEVAVGARWNPGETVDSTKSGSVHFLQRPADVTSRWKAISLPHEPTIHRMRWIKSSEDEYYLMVLPLHGIGNSNGTGKGVNILLYKYPIDSTEKWQYYRIASGMHMTHNFDVQQEQEQDKDGSIIYIAGKEGVRRMSNNFSKIDSSILDTLALRSKGAGEVRAGRLTSARSFLVTIEPMHGNEAAVYINDSDFKRILLDDNLGEGHALAVADFLGVGSDQVAVGWRNPNREGRVGVRLFVPRDLTGEAWTGHWVDNNGMACEDLQTLDLDGDGKPDLVASGRATNNLKIYWNRRK